MQNNIYTISQINAYIAGLFKDDRSLSGITLKGEISNCKYSSAGHIYFTLKDDASQISAVVWRSAAYGLGMRLKDGMQVLATGRISTYEKGGTYQLVAESIEQDGIGALYERYEKLKRSLEAEGLFDPAHKKSIPGYVKTLGIVTAGNGAAVQDIINISKRRNPFIRLILYPARVQGEGAARSVIAGIKRLEEIKPDVIIVGRGGGSFEDLWEFNDEALARVIYDCEIPIISAVGHQTDFTIADFVSDLRAPTPSAAAELAVCEMDELLASLVDLRFELASAIRDRIEAEREKVSRLELALKGRSPRNTLERQRELCENRKQMLATLMHQNLTGQKQRMAANIRALEALSPLKRLEQGYAYVTDTAGKNIKSVDDVKTGDLLNVRVSDGSIKARVEER